MKLSTNQKSEIQQQEFEAKVLTEQQFSKIRHNALSVLASLLDSILT